MRTVGRKGIVEWGKANWWVRNVVLIRVVSVDLTGKIRFKQRLKGGEK
jgi:hypothetical protein